jgi:hypothetical protein
LRCKCGRLLTASRDGSGQRVYYRCTNASNNPSHPRPYLINESRLLPLFQEEVGDVVNVVFVVDTPVDQERLTALTSKRALTIDSFIDGVIKKPERDQRLEVIDKELSSLVTSEKVITVPDWEDDPKAVNEFLRGLFGTVQLDEQMQPTFDWQIKVRALRDKVPQKALIKMSIDNNE